MTDKPKCPTCGGSGEYIWHEAVIGEAEPIPPTGQKGEQGCPDCNGTGEEGEKT